MNNSYLICSTPRTGSTLLCSLLESTGIAGRPQSYFRREDLTKWGVRLNVLQAEGDELDFERYLLAVLNAGRTENGVFSARVMWGSMDDIVANLAELSGNHEASDIDHLCCAFGKLKFIHIQRMDIVSQAVSWARAEQSNVWHRTGKNDLTRSQSTKYDFAAIDVLVGTIRDHNRAWDNWFRANSVTPTLVKYEELDADPEGVTKGVLADLEIPVPSGCTIQSPNLKLADETNYEWIRRYRADSSDVS